MDELFDIKDYYSEESDNEIELENPIDGDLVNEESLRLNFPITYKSTSEIKISKDKSYVLHLDASKKIISAGLSNGLIQILNIDRLQKIKQFEAHEQTISNIKLSASNDNLLYTGSNDGKIKIWDLRTKKCSSTFKDDTSKDKFPKSITCFDISSNERYICAGTDIYEEDAFLLFWDLRNPKFLGGYWECHKDVVTQVCFHPQETDKIASGSTDGLINIFDISQPSEERALQTTLNTGSSVNTLNWHIHQGKEALSCITNSEDFQLWRIEDSAPYLNFDRDSIAYALQRKSASFCYTINVHNTTKQDGCFLLSGSSARNGETLRSLNIFKKLKPHAIFEGNKQLIRKSIYDNETDTFITGGEGCIINVWKQNKITNQRSSNLKMRSKMKNNKIAPY